MRIKLKSIKADAVEDTDISAFQAEVIRLLQQIATNTKR